ncbi:MAG: hypothetical protein PHO48_01860 [Candidatus Gracilibacteria bacterium]|jgi:hypothetical protein|nr:hypothetical protein [Candidatus Gracilibacteria bacterium]MDD5178894.1 hypothetical protein [Candidatus Gracilibacteria bacterium]
MANRGKAIELDCSPDPEALRHRLNSAKTTEEALGICSEALKNSEWSIAHAAQEEAVILFQKNPPTTFPAAWNIFKLSALGTNVQNWSFKLAEQLHTNHTLTEAEADDILKNTESEVLRDWAVKAKARFAVGKITQP